MGAKNSRSLRRPVNAHCRSCIYDDQAPGTWLAQVTLCPCNDCELFDVRPTTNKIPDSVFEYYGEAAPEKCPERLRKAQNEPFSEEAPASSTREEGGVMRRQIGSKGCLDKVKKNWPNASELT